MLIPFLSVVSTFTLDKYHTSIISMASCELYLVYKQMETAPNKHTKTFLINTTQTHTHTPQIHNALGTMHSCATYLSINKETQSTPSSLPVLYKEKISSGNGSRFPRRNDIL
jgi:hypothetical protein